MDERQIRLKYNQGDRNPKLQSRLGVLLNFYLNFMRIPFSSIQQATTVIKFCSHITCMAITININVTWLPLRASEKIVKIHCRK
jgi:hypothetical protein